MVNKKQLKKINMKQVFLGIIGVLVLLVIILAYLLFMAPTEEEKSQREVQKTIEQVSGLMVLPVEEPTLATIEDKEQLSEQRFFEGAEDGDKLLIYPESAKAILYRPSIDKIINVGPLVFENTDANGAVSPAVEEEPISQEIEEEKENNDVIVPDDTDNNDSE